jgi:lipopolysaccharide export system permease protein
MLPNLFLFVIPMASMLGVIICFSRMVNDNEMIAIKAAGIGLYRMLPPVVIFAVCTTLLTGYAATKLIPSSTVALEKLFISLANDKFTKGLTEKQFSEGIRDVVFYINDIDKDTGQWQGVYVSDNRDKENPRIIIASTGSFTGYPDKLFFTVRLNNGSMHLANGATSQTVQFQDYTLNLSLLHSRFTSGKDAVDFGKKAMSQKQLLTFAKKHKSKPDKIIPKLIEYHKRYVLAAGCFILSILGIPFAMRNQPGQRAVGIPLGLSFFIVYYICFTAAKVASESGIPVGLAMWTPNILFAVLALYLLHHAHRERTEDMLDKLLSFVSYIGRLIPKPGRRMPR